MEYASQANPPTHERSSGAAAFEVQPPNGKLSPGQATQATVFFHANVGRTFGIAICELEHGPLYNLPLSGASGAARSVWPHLP